MSKLWASCKRGGIKSLRTMTWYSKDHSAISIKQVTLHAKNLNNMLIFLRATDVVMLRASYRSIVTSACWSVCPSVCHTLQPNQRCKLRSYNLHCGLSQGLQFSAIKIRGAGWRELMPSNEGRHSKRTPPPKKKTCHFCRYCNSSVKRLQICTDLVTSFPRVLTSMTLKTTLNL